MGKVLPQYKVPPGDLPNITIASRCGREVLIVILFYFIFLKKEMNE